MRLFITLTWIVTALIFLATGSLYLYTGRSTLALYNFGTALLSVLVGVLYWKTLK